MPTTRRSTLVSSSSPLEASRSHHPRPRPRRRHRNASSPSSSVVRVLSNRSTRVCFLFSVFFRVAVERKRWFLCECTSSRRCVFYARKRSVPVARGIISSDDCWYATGTTTTTTIGVRASSSINRFQEEKKTRRVVVCEIAKKEEEMDSSSSNNRTFLPSGKPTPGPTP